MWRLGYDLPAGGGHGGSGSRVGARGCDGGVGDGRARRDRGAELQDGDVIVGGAVAVLGVEGDGGHAGGGSA